jgi:hypothetical protein
MEVSLLVPLDTFYVAYTYLTVLILFGHYST